MSNVLLSLSRVAFTKQSFDSKSLCTLVTQILSINYFGQFHNLRIKKHICVLSRSSQSCFFFLECFLFAKYLLPIVDIVHKLKSFSCWKLNKYFIYFKTYKACNNLVNNTIWMMSGDNSGKCFLSKFVFTKTNIDNDGGNMNRVKCHHSVNMWLHACLCNACTSQEIFTKTDNEILTHSLS